MMQDKACEVVICNDETCRLCTATRPGEAAASMNHAYIVYTCESPTCSLCREEPDVLLDLFCPFNSIQDIKEMSRKIINIIGTENVGEEITRSSQPDLAPIPKHARRAGTDTPTGVVPINEGSTMLRELLQSKQGNLKSNETDLDITQNLKIDETQLMNIARELEVDQLSDLPELTDQGISDFIQQAEVLSR